MHPGLVGLLMAAMGAPWAGAAPASEVERVHGYRVRDPFRVLETEAGARRWIEIQNRKTETQLRGLGGPGVAARLGELLSIGVVSRPRVSGGRTFYLARDEGVEQSILYWLDGEKPVPLVDPNELSRGGEKVAIDWYYPSRTGKLVAYGLSKDGDEESELRVVEVETGKDRGERIPHTRACDLAWLPEDAGFYYTRYPAEGLYDRRVHLHRLGDDPREDPLVFGEGRARTDWPSVGLSPDGRQVLLGVFQGWTSSELHLLRHGGRVVRPLFTGHASRLEGAEWLGNRIVARTNHGAPRWRLVSLSPGRPEPEHWRTLVPEGAGVLDAHLVTGKYLVIHRVERAVSRLLVHRLDGTLLREIELPGPGTVADIDAEPAGGPVVFTYSSFFHAPEVFRFDPAAGEVESVARVATDVDTSRWVVRQVDYPSYDGTRVPMFLVHEEGLELDGDHPTLLSGYGGFDVSLTPSFRRNVLFWLERGGIYAVANLRGGGELGEAWHRAGKREKKFQVFEDFEYAARYLHREGYTNPARLAVIGGSNGGLLVGAAITRFPHLFRAAIGSVGLYDMLRFHRFPPAELWVDEYGDPEDPADFGYLLGYSPYHQVVDGVRYPACLLVTADKDTRVHWAHTAKFAARLQEATASEHPVLFYLSRKEGHGSGKGRSDIIREYTRKYAFLLAALGLDGGAGTEGP